MSGSQSPDKSHQEPAIKPQEPVGAYLCQSTATFTEYWKRGAWNEPNREQALICMEQAVNGWKNLAYSLAKPAHYYQLQQTGAPLSHVAAPTAMERVRAGQAGEPITAKQAAEAIQGMVEPTNCRAAGVGGLAKCRQWCGMAYCEPSARSSIEPPKPAYWAWHAKSDHYLVGHYSHEPKEPSPYYGKPLYLSAPSAIGERPPLLELEIMGLTLDVLDEVEALRRGVAITHVGPDPVKRLRFYTPNREFIDKTTKALNRADGRGDAK